VCTVGAFVWIVGHATTFTRPLPRFKLLESPDTDASHIGREMSMRIDSATWPQERTAARAQETRMVADCP
jgi:hypothetical protein